MNVYMYLPTMTYIMWIGTSSLGVGLRRQLHQSDLGHGMSVNGGDAQGQGPADPDHGQWQRLKVPSRMNRLRPLFKHV